MHKINLSAIVVGFNEASFLKDCLESISFCKEILYFDLGSTDNSTKIAEYAGASIIHHPRVLNCEWIHAKFANTTKYEWLIILDPDEVVDRTLANQVIEIFDQGGFAKDICALKVPWKFYFKNKPLLGTPWGGENSRIFIANKMRFTFTSDIHLGRKPMQGFRIEEIKSDGSNCIHHFWMRDTKMLFEKHLRYLKNEGEARFNNEERSSIVKILYTPIKQFHFSFIRKKGYKNLISGFLLSIFWAWYQTAACLKVLQFQNSKKIEAEKEN